MGKLSDFGLFASRFNSNTIFLTQFDEAVRYFKRTKDNRSAQEVAGFLLHIFSSASIPIRLRAFLITMVTDSTSASRASLSEAEDVFSTGMAL